MVGVQGATDGVVAAVARPSKVEFLRRAELPGVELVDVLHTSLPWQCYATAFELVVSRTWRADIAYRQEVFRVRPGVVFCAEPGELFRTSGIHEPGDVGVLCISQEATWAHLRERNLVTGEAPSVMAQDLALSHGIEQLRLLLKANAEPLEVQAAYFEMMDAFVRTFGGERAPISRINPRDEATARQVREWLHSERTGRVDLQRLSESTGRSRYQVLRAFKRRYGLPPHAYHLCVRLAQAQESLARGEAPAQVAVEYGFVDQSHFSKHFKRLVGVTPAQYARSAGRRGFRPRTPRLVLQSDRD